VRHVARAGGAIACGLALVGAATASAATFKPTRFDDPVPNGCKPHNCSLREAVRAANKSSSPTRKLVLSKGRYRLTIPEAPADPNDASGGDLDVAGGVKIVGAGARKTSVSGEGLNRVFHFQGTLNEFQVRDLKIRRGDAGDGDGGGILATNLGGALKLKRVILKANSAASGAGIYYASGELTVSQSTIAGGEASVYGGGIFLPAAGNLGAATAEIRASTIARNHAVGVGGGVAVDGSDPGGFPATPELYAVNSTFALNQADVSGGGLSAIQNSDVTLDNSTVAYNAADLDNSGGGNGGGVYQSTSADFRLYDSIVQGNTVGTSGEGPTCAGEFLMPYATLTPQAGASCSILGGSVTQGEDPPKLGSLGANGGPTQTVNLLSGSAAIGFSDSGCPKKDQRGVRRPTSDCDAGAFERRKP
jgi:hypothetical protein